MSEVTSRYQKCELMNKLKSWLKQLNAYADKHLQTWEVERKR